MSQAFGVETYEPIEPLIKGHTAELVFRIVVKGVPYLLKIFMRAYIIGPERQIHCMRAAAEGGVFITDFVNQVPFSLDDAPKQQRFCPVPT